MNWDAVGAISEGLGAVAVFITLAYLAVQVRQNTTAQRNGARLEAMKGMTDWFSIVMTHPDLQEVWWRSFVSPETITEGERFNVLWMMSALANRYETIYSQHKAGLVDGELWQAYRRSMAGFLQYPIIRTWWDAEATIFPADFRREIDTTAREQWIDYVARARDAHGPRGEP